MAGAASYGTIAATGEGDLRVVTTASSTCHNWPLITLSVGIAAGIVAVTTTAVVLSAASSGGNNAPSPYSFTPLNNSLTWITFGDWGRNGTKNQFSVAEAMSQYAARYNASFIVSVGDQFYWAGVVSETDPQWNSSFLNVYTQESLRNRPWYLIGGNHDYDGNVTAELNWGRDPYKRWKFPALNYTMTWPLPNPRDSRDCVMAVFVDTCPFISAYRTKPESSVMAANLNASNPDAQLQWINEQVTYACSACRAVFVTGHHPVFSGGYHGNEPDLINRFLPIFNRTTVSAYLAGHEHSLMHLASAGVDYIISGAGSDIRTDTKAINETVWFKDTSGFVISSLNGTHAYHAWIGVDLRTLHETLHPLRS